MLNPAAPAASPVHDEKVSGARTPRVGEQINALLAARRMPRSRLIGELGISASALAQYISGKNTPRLETLCRLADLFDVSLDELICGDAWAAEPDLNPVEAAMDERLDTLLARASAQRDLSVRVAMLLADEIDRAVRASRGDSDRPGGMLTDEETLLLEAAAEESWIASLDLFYDIRQQDGDARAGRFARVVAANLAQERRYRFLLPANLEPARARTLADAMRTVLRDTYRCPQAAIRRCEFRHGRDAQFSGVGFYRLADPTLLPARTRMLLERVRAVTEGDGRWLGYVIPPSTQVHGDLLMDARHLADGRQLFEQRWHDAARL